MNAKERRHQAVEHNAEEWIPAPDIATALRGLRLTHSVARSTNGPQRSSGIHAPGGPEGWSSTQARRRVAGHQPLRKARPPSQ